MKNETIKISDQVFCLGHLQVYRVSGAIRLRHSFQEGLTSITRLGFMRFLGSKEVLMDLIKDKATGSL